MKLYGTRSNGRHHGVVLTKTVVVEKMLDLVAYLPSRDLRNLRVVEPAAGEGVFAISLIDRLYESSLAFDFDFQKALDLLEFYEIDAGRMNVLRAKVSEQVSRFGANAPESLFRLADFLTAPTAPCDLIIGNPPYVRHENIPDAKKEIYKRDYRTFTHRSDLYIPFFEKGLSLLKPGGRLSYICSNRWLKNQYGKRLRELIAARFHIQSVIDLEKVSDAFEESVIAYPAIATIENKAPEPDGKGNYFQVDDLDALIRFSDDSQPARSLSLHKAGWFTNEYPQAHATNLISPIDRQGFTIGIGVATGKDKLFIRKDFGERVESRLLLPVLTSKCVRGDAIRWQGNFVLNPFEANGELIDLDRYPKAKAYLEVHREALSNRHVAKKNSKNWFRTIDRVYPSLTRQPKIILPDISGNKFIHIDKGEYYPHHNLYYITGREIEKLELLAAVLMSDFVKKQLADVGNKMNGGYPRWQSQNIRKLQVPVIDAMPEATVRELLTAYREKDLDSINRLITLEHMAEYKVEAGQLALFEPSLTEFYSAKDPV